MMKNRRKKHGAEFKAKVALEAIKGVKTVNEIASQYEVHPTQVTNWKKQAIRELSGVFSGRGEKAEEELKARLYQQIGQLQVELEWLKKKFAEDN